MGKVAEDGPRTGNARKDRPRKRGGRVGWAVIKLRTCQVDAVTWGKEWLGHV